LFRKSAGTSRARPIVRSATSRYRAAARQSQDTERTTTNGDVHQHADQHGDADSLILFNIDEQAAMDVENRAA